MSSVATTSRPTNLRPTPARELVRFLVDPRVRADPYPRYERLREDGPTQHTLLGVSVVSGYEESLAVLRSRSVSSVESHMDLSLTGGRSGRGLLAEVPARLAFRLALRVQATSVDRAFIEMSKRFLILMDPPDHTRIRALATRAFTPRVADDARPMIEGVTTQVLDSLDPSQPVELMTTFAYRVPILVICRLLGVPEADEEYVCGLVPPLVRGIDIDGLLSKQIVAAADRAAVEISRYFTALAEQRRVDPGDDLFSALVAATADGDRLNSDELVAFAALLFAAGFETTANLLGNGFWQLHAHPEQWARWCDEPAIRSAGVHELLRYDPPVQVTQRIALEPLEVGGIRIPSGRQLTVLLGAANRDPRVHPDPDALDLTRSPCRPLSFGFGIHHCIGAALAQVEVEIALGMLADRFPRVRPVDPLHASWRRSIVFRGLTELPVHLR
jgi:cytochrome P450